MKVLIVHVFIIPNGNVLFLGVFKNDAEDIPNSVMILICVCLLLVVGPGDALGVQGSCTIKVQHASGWAWDRV